MRIQTSVTRYFWILHPHFPRFSVACIDYAAGHLSSLLGPRYQIPGTRNPERLETICILDTNVRNRKAAIENLDLIREASTISRVLG